MAYILGKIRVKNKRFEIMVDCDKALAFKKGVGNVNIGDALLTKEVFSDVKKGLLIKETELKETFGTTDIEDISKKIIKEGELQVPAEYKEAERENKLKQIINFISTHYTDPKGMPHPPQRVESALKQIRLNIQNRPIEEQIPEILKNLQTVLPLRIETRKMSITVPAVYTGHLYGVLKDYIVKEEWLSDGSLSCIVSLPSAVQMSFFDKINSISHGNVITKEMKE